jgi:hypothetical protein
VIFVCVSSLDISTDAPVHFFRDIDIWLSPA